MLTKVEKSLFRILAALTKIRDSLEKTPNPQGGLRMVWGRVSLSIQVATLLFGFFAVNVNAITTIHDIYWNHQAEQCAIKTFNNSENLLQNSTEAKLFAPPTKKELEESNDKLGSPPANYDLSKMSDEELEKIASPDQHSNESSNKKLDWTETLSYRIGRKYATNFKKNLMYELIVRRCSTYLHIFKYDNNSKIYINNWGEGSLPINYETRALYLSLSLIVPVLISILLSLFNRWFFWVFKTSGVQ